MNGHDLRELTEILRYARDLKEPVLLHVRTIKGKDFTPAEENPDAYHGVSPFDPETGEPLKQGRASFSSVFGREVARLAREDPRVCAVTAAMQTGTGLDYFALQFPDRFFDVGIAEGCAVSMAAGMAKQGAVPVVAVYSTFLQRAYDMLSTTWLWTGCMWCWQWTGPGWLGRMVRPTRGSLTCPISTASLGCGSMPPPILPS